MSRSAPSNSRPAVDQVEPLLVPRKEAFLALNIGSTRGQQLINSGMIDAVKLGGKTMIRAESLRRFVAGLPSARENGEETAEKFRRLRAQRRDARTERQTGTTEQ